MSVPSMISLPLFFEVRIVDVGMLEQELVELRLDRGDRDVLAIGAFVAAVEVGAAFVELQAS